MTSVAVQALEALKSADEAVLLKIMKRLSDAKGCELFWEARAQVYATLAAATLEAAHLMGPTPEDQARLDALELRAEYDAEECACGHMAGEHDGQGGECSAECDCDGFSKLVFVDVGDGRIHRVRAEMARLDEAMAEGPSEQQPGDLPWDEQ